MPIITLPNGQEAEFPDSMSSQDIEAVLQKQFPTQAQQPAQPAQPAPEPKSMIGAFGAGLGQGVGNVALGAQNLVGMGLEKVGLDTAGQWLQNDATQGKAKLEREANHYAEQYPITTGTAKFGGEVLATLPAGGLLAKGVGAVAKGFGVGTKAAPMVEALRTGGFNAGGLTGPAGVATRSVGRAVTGGLSAALVNPEDAGLGAAIGWVLPGAVQVAGKAGQYLAKNKAARLSEALKEFNRTAPKNETVRQSIEAGYKIPPNMVKSSLKNQIVESISGKQATQQIASEANEKVTGGLVRKALGIADDAPITQSTLENLRKTAGKTYEEVSSLSAQAADDLEALKIARNEASGWFKAYNRSASPIDLAKAKEARALSDSLENALEKHALDAGKKELIPSLRDARKQIAKTYTVGRAVNDASGTVDARVLGRMYEKGMPLSDGLDQAGRFASAFPTIAKSSQQVGSPAAHNLKSLASLGVGMAGGATMGPIGMAAAAIPFIAPPVARAAMFREGAQKALIQQAPKETAKAKALAQLLRNPELQQLLLRSAPVVAAQ